MSSAEERSTGGSGGLAWRRLGQGPPLLLVNGYAATKDDWDPNFLTGLAGSSTVICPDNRGVGDSPRGVEALTIESMAADLVVLLDQLEIDSVDVAGWSMGGFVAQTLVTRVPERIRSLTLLSTDAGGSSAERRTPEMDQALTDKSGSPEQQADRLIDLLFPPDFAAQVKSAAGSIVADARSRLDPDVLAEQESAMADWYRSPDPPVGRISSLANDGLPVLIAHGLEDKVIPAANSRMLSAAIEDSWLAPFPGGGHAFMAQEPDRLGSLISLFLSR